MSVPDTREIEDNEGPAGERADDAGGADGNDAAGVGDNDVVKLQQLTMQGGQAGHSWHSWGLVTGLGHGRWRRWKGSWGWCRWQWQ